MAWMRQKSEPENTTVSEQPAASTPPSTSAPTPAREKKMEKLVNIGQSVAIKGELTGNEDLTIEGKVDGKIVVKDHNLTIGANGRITAEVHAKCVVVVGTVTGNVTADDKSTSSNATKSSGMATPTPELAHTARTGNRT